MTRWKYTTYSPSLSFEENVIYNNHISNEPKDFQKGVASKAKRQVGKQTKSISTFKDAVKHLEDNGLVQRWTSAAFTHYSSITEYGLDFKADTASLEIWCSNRWNGLPDGFQDTLTFMLLSSWRFDRHLRSQSIHVNVNADDLARRFGGSWSSAEIQKRINFLRKNGNLHGNMLSELTFSPELESGYQRTEIR